MINEDEAEYVKYIFNKYALGIPIRQILNTLNALEVRTHSGNRFEHRTVTYPFNLNDVNGYVMHQKLAKTI